MAARSMKQLHQHYQRFVTQYPRAVSDFVEAIEDVLSDSGLAYDTIRARVKEWRSLREKATKRRDDHTLLYPNPLEDIHDIIGVRITTYHSNEIPHIIDALADAFVVVRSVDKAAQTKVAGSFGYGSHHLVLMVDSRVEALKPYEKLKFEVQIRTVLQHAWAEFEHDIRYKRRSGSLDPAIDRAFTLAAGLIELADQQFDLIAALEEPDDNRNPIDVDVEFSADTLPGIITMLVGNKFPPSRSESYQWLEELLHAHGITKIVQLKELLSDSLIAKVRSALAYQYQPGQVRILDDVLLARFGEAHIEKTGRSGDHPSRRAGRLRKRLALLKPVIDHEGHDRLAAKTLPASPPQSPTLGRVQR